MDRAEVEKIVVEVIGSQIRDIIKEELKSFKHECRFSDITDSDAKCMGQYVHQISRLGDGDIENGFDLVRQNHLWLKNLRENGGWASKIFWGVLLTTIIGASLKVFFDGVKAVLK